MSEESSEFRVVDVVLGEDGSPLPVVGGTPARVGTFRVEVSLDIPEDAQSVDLDYAMDPRNWRIWEQP